MDARRQLPSIDRLVRLVADLPHALAVREARALVDAVRAGEEPPEDWGGALRTRVDLARRLRLRRVINATGVVLHTNLGRAPLGADVAAAVADVAQGYVNLELDLESGERSERLAGLGEPLRALTGAEAALAVNNNAAATLLMLTALAAGREVVVSRGELVEIGGGFRIPEVIAAGGARLVEVGTTNRTRIGDYAAVLRPETAAILRVHPSNFRVTGFTASAERAELVALARARGVLYLEDLGSGALLEGLGETSVAEVLAEGPDVVTISGDKLLGGPQAGIALGAAEPIRRMRRHPLYRALRLDRLVLAALEATLRAYLAGDVPPAVAMLRAEPRALAVRARVWAAALAGHGIVARTEADVGFAGGGSRPEDALPTTVLVLEVPDPDGLARRLRLGSPPVMVRVAGGAVRLDPRAVLPEEEPALIEALTRACGSTPGA
jgi:L-seryl-tRNA(Ser) seleniumtransferase